MSEFNFDGKSDVEIITNKVWETFDILRSEPISSEDYYVILFLLSLYKDGYLIEIDVRNAEKVRYSLLVALQYAEQKYNFPYLQIHKSFDHSISGLSKNGINGILKLFSQLDFVILRRHFAYIFDNILYRTAKSQGRISGEYIQPLELTRLVLNLADLATHAKIYNPFAGTASFGVFLKNSNEYFGQEINSTVWAIGALRLHAYNRWGSSKYQNDNSITNWDPDHQKYDLIVVNPPFRMRLESEGIQDHKTVESFLFDNGISSLSKNGKLILILPSSFLFSGGAFKLLRTYLVEHNLIDIVISIPGGLLINTGLQLVVLVINKSKQKPGLITLVDGSKFIEGKGREQRLKDLELYSVIKNGEENNCIRFIEDEQVRKLDYNLNVPRYFKKEYEGVLLSEILHDISSPRQISSYSMKNVRIRDLKDDRINYKLDVGLLEENEVSRSTQLISETCLLLAARWKTLKPTLFEYNGIPILISKDIIALQFDASKVDIGFLINELHANYINEQLDSFRIGSVIPSIRKDELLSIKVQLPSIIDQRAKIKMTLEALAKEKKQELLLFNKIHGLETEMYEQNTYLRHTLAGPASNLKDSISNIKKIVLERISPKYPELLELKVSDQHLVSLGEYLEIIARDANKIVQAVSNQLKINTGIDEKKLVPIEIISFLEKYSIEYNDRAVLNFSIKFDFDKEVFVENGIRVKTFILGNEELLMDLFDNLIDNARKHAFRVGYGNRIEIFVMKRSELQADEIQILFSNTGIPFPEDFSKSEFIRKGAKYGVNAGDGFGGWYINEIIKSLNGNFEIIDETGPEGLPDTDLATSFEINFPIIETEEDE